ncbi:5' SurE family protein [Coleophoma cylindrospora]|uniref:5' SurE family protein n=1 Tax=Coleophoma cylindrospora TaxID=1849047 RepID=A0A3D8QTX1_9HELO|nr:5' SurE family protein [Coleophoma cylindrospora]
MRLSPTLLALVPIAQAVNVVLSNDDGWAEINVRQFYDTLTSGGDSVVLSAPAENESGTGSLTGTPSTLTEACEFDSCASGSPAYGSNSSNTRLNYVNSYPATAMAYGINTLSETYFGGSPDIAVAGPNVGANLGAAVWVSGTVGATTAAVKLGIPGIAFSGTTGAQTAWDVSPVPSYSTVYAELSANITNTLIASGTPYLPTDIWLNVNFPASTDTSCTSAADFSFVLSRIFTATIISSDDAVTCGNGGRLPTETAVVGTSGCYASISVGSVNLDIDASAADQTTVLEKLSSILSCLP